MKTNFETRPCPRCHGSGRYSYCQQYGDKCFKCAGSGLVLTKRGERARAYLEELCTVNADQLKVGDRVATTGITRGGRVFGYIATVVNINNEAKSGLISTSFEGPLNRYLAVTTEHPKFGRVVHGVYADSKFRAYPKNNAELIAKAVAYQNTLTKTGTERVRKAG